MTNKISGESYRVGLYLGFEGVRSFVQDEKKIFDSENEGLNGSNSAVHTYTKQCLSYSFKIGVHIEDAKFIS